MDEHEDWAGDAAAYALGALDRDEATRFEDHLKRCPACRSELSEMRAAVVALPLGAPQVKPPKEVRRRVLAQARDEARDQARGEARGPRVAGRLPVPALSAAVGALCAAAVAIVLLAGGGTTVRTYRGRVFFVHGSAELQVGSGTPELIVRRMPAPPRGKIYEVWVLRGRRAVATSALFDVNASGSATVAVPASIRGATGVAVTPEPRGGSRHPTAPGVIAVTL